MINLQPPPPAFLGNSDPGNDCRNARTLRGQSSGDVGMKEERL
jgi:hypothetical protein